MRVLWCGLALSQAVRTSFRSEEQLLAAVREGNDLLSWASQHGATGIDNVQFAMFNHTGVTMRGLAVSKDVPSGVVLEMPEDTLLTLLNSKFTGGLKLPADGDHRTKHHGILATHRAIGKDSPFKEYIDSLPTAEVFASFHPLKASDEVLEAFHGLPLAQLVESRRRDVEAQWQEWQSFVTQSQGTGPVANGAIAVGRDDFEWAYLSCVTHCFGLPLVDKDSGHLVKATAMVPVADACNTDKDPNVVWMSDHESSPNKFQLSSIHELKAGTEIIVPYAGKINGYTNEAYADEWGFAMVGAQGSDAVGEVDPWPASDPRCKQVADLAKASPPDAESAVIWQTFLSVSLERCPSVNKGTSNSSATSANDQMFLQLKVSDA